MVGAAGLLWLLIWAFLYRTPANPQGGFAKEPVPLRSLWRSRWVSQFTTSTIFSDPAWYFYIFWFPQYLKSARGFGIAEFRQSRSSGPDLKPA